MALSHWACAQLHAHHERLALHCLGLAGYTVYQPRIAELCTVRGRRVDVSRPLPLLLRYVPLDVRRMNDLWPELIASEIFAEHFAQSDLRQQVVNHFMTEPRSSCAAAALAEAALRMREPELEELLRDKVRGIKYDIATAFRVRAVTGNVDQIVDTLESVLNNNLPGTHSMMCVYWVPALLRRIERDEALADALLQGPTRPGSDSVKLSELTLAGKGMANKAKARSALAAALKEYEAAEAPVVAFDVTADRYRLAQHALSEMLE